MDFLERIGEGYLTRKAMGLPQQLENAAVKQWTSSSDPKPASQPKPAPQPAPEIHTPPPERKNPLTDLRSASRDEEIARLRKELAAAKLSRNDARYLPNTTYPRRAPKAAPDSPVYSEREPFYPRRADPRREIVRDRHAGLKNVAKPRRSSTTPISDDESEHEPEPRVVEVGRSKSVAGYAPSRAPSHAPSHAASHAPSYHRALKQPEPYRVPVYRGPQAGIVALPPPPESSRGSAVSPKTSPKERHRDDFDTASQHSLRSHRSHQSHQSHQSHHTARPAAPASVVLSNAGSRASKSRAVEYGWEQAHPRSRRRSEYGWDVGSWASEVPGSADEAPRRRRSHGGREREIREERIVTRSPVASPALPAAPVPPVSARLSTVGSMKGSVRGSVRGGSDEAEVDEYNLIEIDGGGLVEGEEGLSGLPDGYDVVEVIEDGHKKTRARRRRRSVKKITY